MQSKKSDKAHNGKPVIPKRIFALVSPKSIGGVSLFESREMITHKNVQNFYSEQELITRCVYRLQDAGFEVLQAGNAFINIAGSEEAYQNAFNARIFAEERPTIKTLPDKEETATFLESPTADLPGLIGVKGSRFEDIVEGVALEAPQYFMTPSMFAPTKAYWHLTMPGDVSLGCNADQAHRAGITGKDIHVAMVDSGWYKHPYFTGRGYRVSPVVLGPAAANPLDDEVGHGTGESANIFAVAPDVTLHPVKLNFVNSVGAFNAAVALNPHIITCSWGRSIRFGPLDASAIALAAAVAAAVAAGVVVIFSAANGGYGFPGQHPDVISAGGVYMNANGDLRASDYASGFMSNVYPNRRVPDLCGLVGMLPHAQYIMLPLQEGDEIDVGNSGGAHPNGDETLNNDGWAAFSGTSAAAPQLAGAAALIKQACNRLTPAEVRDILMTTARDVTAGNCSPFTGGHPAVVGPDLATGNGLVNAHKAALVARLRCLRIVPGPIVDPVRPVIQPRITEPEPIRDVREPIPPVPIPREPIGVEGVSSGTGTGTGTGRPAPTGKTPTPQGYGTPQLTRDDIEMLEQMILNSDDFPKGVF